MPLSTGKKKAFIFYIRFLFNTIFIPNDIIDDNLSAKVQSLKYLHGFQDFLVFSYFVFFLLQCKWINFTSLWKKPSLFYSESIWVSSEKKLSWKSLGISKTWPFSTKHLSDIRFNRDLEVV